MGPGDTSLYLSSAPSYRSIQNMPFERCCSLCCAGVRSNTACSARCSTASSEQSALRPECQLRSTSQLVFAILRRGSASPPLTAVCRCTGPGSVLWSLGLSTVFGCMSFAVGAYLLSCLLSKTGLEQEEALGRQVCTLAPGLPDCQASLCTQRK